MYTATVKTLWGILLKPFYPSKEGGFNSVGGVWLGFFEAGVALEQAKGLWAIRHPAGGLLPSLVPGTLSQLSCHTMLWTIGSGDRPQITRLTGLLVTGFYQVHWFATFAAAEIRDPFFLSCSFWPMLHSKRDLASSWSLCWAAHYTYMNCSWVWASSVLHWAYP